MIYNLNGAIPSPPDERDWDIAAAGIASTQEVKSTEYPSDYIVSNLPEEIYDQSIYPTCVSFALALIKEVQDKKENAPFEEKRCSPGFIYANRADDDYQGDGMVSRQALKRLQKIGVCAWSDFPVNRDYPEVKEMLEAKDNYEELYHGAFNRSILAYYRIYTLEELKYTLMNIGPVLASIPAYSGFCWNAQTGEMLPGPSSHRTGNHAVVFVGWKNDSTIIVRNSWGPDWGDGGYGYLDFNTYHINEMWAITDRSTPEIEAYYRCKIGMHEYEEYERKDYPDNHCTEITLLETACRHCGHVASQTELSRTFTHEYGEWEVTQEVTSCQEGRQVSVCKKCFETKIMKIDPLGHPFGDWQIIRQPTLIKSARYRRECTACGFVEYKEDPRPKSLFSVIVEFFKGLIKILKGEK